MVSFWPGDQLVPVLLSSQAVTVVRPAVSTLTWRPGARARSDAAEGRAGRAAQAAAAVPVAGRMTAARPPVRMPPAVPPAPAAVETSCRPLSFSGADVAQGCPS